MPAEKIHGVGVLVMLLGACVALAGLAWTLARVLRLT
jgi:hypothetical protein